MHACLHAAQVKHWSTHTCMCTSLPPSLPVCLQLLKSPKESVRSKYQQLVKPWHKICSVAAPGKAPCCSTHSSSKGMADPKHNPLCLPPGWLSCCQRRTHCTSACSWRPLKPQHSARLGTQHNAVAVHHRRACVLTPSRAIIIPPGCLLAPRSCVQLVRSVAWRMCARWSRRAGVK